MTWPRIAVAAVTCASILLSEGCAKRIVTVLPEGTSSATIAELWDEPADLEQRDLLHGPGGQMLRPRETTFAFVAEDNTGWSRGFDVRDREGVTWSVKIGPEAQTEIVTSRILWAIGYHQPATYYLEDWTLSGGPDGKQPPGRFRPDVPGEEIVGDWSWYENPFVDSRPYRGLIVANLILNNWDWKTSNNKIYSPRESVGGVRRRYVVRDLGASLGKTSYPVILKWFRLRGFGQGTRNDVAGFEEQGFIKGIDDDSRIVFDYRGIYRDIVDIVTPADVQWTCALLARMSDRQLSDAFAAAGYAPDVTARYVRKIREKIQQGLNVSEALKSAKQADGYDAIAVPVPSL